MPHFNIRMLGTPHQFEVYFPDVHTGGTILVHLSYAYRQSTSPLGIWAVIISLSPSPTSSYHVRILSGAPGPWKVESRRV